MDQPQTPMDNTQPSASSKKKGGLVKLTIIIVIILLLGGAAYYFFGTKSPSENGVMENTDIVATVNGVDITQQDVDDRILRNKDSLTAQGVDLNDPTMKSQVQSQVVTQLVNEFLVVAEARRLGLSVTSDEIDQAYADIKARFETDEAFQAELAKNRFTEEALRSNVERELLTQKYVQYIEDSNQIEVTDEEIQELYDNAVEQSDSVPPLDEIRDQVRQQIHDQKLSQLVAQAVEALRSQADIVTPDASEGDQTPTQ